MSWYHNFERTWNEHIIWIWVQWTRLTAHTTATSKYLGPMMTNILLLTTTTTSFLYNKCPLQKRHYILQYLNSGPSPSRTPISSVFFKSCCTPSKHARFLKMSALVLQQNSHLKIRNDLFFRSVLLTFNVCLNS